MVAPTLMADYQGEELQELIPAAFFKSIGLTGVSTALGGAFVGMNNPRAAEVADRWPAAQSGGMILVVDIGLFSPSREFRQGVDHLVRGVRETMAPVRGYDEATVPGTIEHRKEREATTGYRSVWKIWSYSTRRLPTSICPRWPEAPFWRTDTTHRLARARICDQLLGACSQRAAAVLGV